MVCFNVPWPPHYFCGKNALILLLMEGWGCGLFQLQDCSRHRHIPQGSALYVDRDTCSRRDRK